MYTYTQAAHLLGVSRATLNRWCAKDKIRPARDPMEWRRRLLSSAQVAKLAKAHKRVIIAPASVEKLEKRLAQLEAQLLLLSDERRE